MMNDYDVLIAGSGVAGLYAALNFAPEVRVLVLSKKERMLCNSALAQGGLLRWWTKKTTISVSISRTR